MRKAGKAPGANKFALPMRRTRALIAQAFSAASGKRTGGSEPGLRQQCQANPLAALAEMPPGARGPLADKPVIECTTERAAEQRDDAGSPFLRHLGTETRGNKLNDAWNRAFDGLFLDEFPTQVQAGRAGRGYPQHGLVLFGAKFKPVKQAELLKHAEQDRRKDAHVGNKCGNAAESEAGAFEQSQPPRSRHGRIGNALHLLVGQPKRIFKSLDGQAMSILDGMEVEGRIHADGGVGAREA